MTKKFFRSICILSLAVILAVSGAVNISASSVADITDENDVAAGVYAFGDPTYNVDLPSIPASRSTEKNPSDYKDLKLYVGGMPFGVKFMTEGVLVVGFNDNLVGASKNPARIAGIACNDVLLSIDGKEITSAAELNEMIGASSGKTLKVKYSRGGKEYVSNMTPSYSAKEGRYISGLYVRDSGAGIGTVTFISPKSRAFGGLGHGICDTDTGKLIPMQRGAVVGVKISGIVKGLCGSPGEVKGYFNSGKTGTLLGNTDCGVYGVFAELPKEIHGEPMSIGLRNSVKNGRAYVYCMLDGERVEKYEVEISDIQVGSTSNKCFTVKVTDKRLLNKTGGIIQGMSGSPLVQNGKLIGAVTHVLINDPTTGYGIFIENMLTQMGDLVS